MGFTQRCISCEAGVLAWVARKILMAFTDWEDNCREHSFPANWNTVRSNTSVSTKEIITSAPFVSTKIELILKHPWQCGSREWPEK